jgi:hypothetical protein
VTNRYLRLRLAHWIFPETGYGRVANRIIWRCDTPKLDVSLVIRKKAEADGYSWDEMLAILDIFLGRATTTEEWNKVLSWKAKQ